MKKTALLLLTFISFSLMQLPLQAYSWYDEQAEYEVAREEAIARQARIRAKKEELIRRDAEAFATIINGILYVISSTGKVIFQCETNDTEKVVGFLGAGALFTAACAGIYKLLTDSAASRKTTTSIYVYRR
jgi:hypothetical protein